MTLSRPEVLAAPESPPRDTAGRRERILVGLFCLLAALRIFVFTAAFPFFNNVDEHYHFDLVCRYAHGDVPQGLEPCSPEAAALIARYGSPEYVWALQDFPERKTPPPVWSRPAAEQAKLFAERQNVWRHEVNHEAVQPPLYYAVVGLWYDLGKRLGIEGGNLLYWARFFNIPLYVLLVWLSYWLAKELVPVSRFVYLGVPFVLAFFPQDVYCGLNNDVLSAPLVTLSLCLLVRLYRAELARPGLALGAGLAAAAAVLTKFTNVPILVVLGAVALLKLGPAWWKKQPLTHLAPVVVLLLASGIPVACWLARNYLVLGDLTGFVVRSRFMMWTPKPLGQYWHHPVFTPSGLTFFWNNLVITLWRGEFLWHQVHLTAGILDTFYFLSSTLFPLIFVLAALAGNANMRPETRTAVMFCLPLFALHFALLGFFSVSVEFSTKMFNIPSPQEPYVDQGRLLLGGIVPFLILYLGGLEVLLRWLRLGFARVPVLVILVDVMAISQIAAMLDVFASQYNWFHLP